VDPVASAALGVVQRIVGKFLQCLRGREPDSNGNTDAHGSVDLLALMGYGQFAYGLQYLRRNTVGCLPICARKKADELFAAGSGQQVRIPHAGFERASKRLQVRIAGGVPTSVIDGLEVVNVKRHDGHGEFDILSI
jgi:hypothetical protein